MNIPPAKIFFTEADKEEILGKIGESLTTGQLTLGKNGKAFEEEFAKYLGLNYAIAVIWRAGVLSFDGKENPNQFFH